MKKTLLRIMAALLTLMIGIGAAAAGKTEEEDPVVVRVGSWPVWASSCPGGAPGTAPGTGRS